MRFWLPCVVFTVVAKEEPLANSRKIEEAVVITMLHEDVVTIEMYVAARRNGWMDGWMEVMETTHTVL